MESAAIRYIDSGDYDQWLPLWEENCLHQIAPDVTAETWKRLCDPSFPVNGIGVWDNGHLCAILHYVLHPVTGLIEPVCYMQDLFVQEQYRRKGYARDLVLMLDAMGKDEKWGRIYWIAQHNNDAAQTLYKSIGYKLDFSFHILPITQRT